MDKAFENMDKRFKNIEDELNYQYDSSLWNDVEGTIQDTALDVAFVEATNAATFSAANFSGVEDAFLDDAFIESAKTAKNNYESSYFSDFKAVESELYQNDSFVSAASMASATYQSEYWNDADLALQQEGLHHEYKSNYWKEAERLLLKDERKAFFMRWGAVATILLLLSFAGLKFNGGDSISSQFANVASDSKLDVKNNFSKGISSSNENLEIKNLNISEVLESEKIVENKFPNFSTDNSNTSIISDTQIQRNKNNNDVAINTTEKTSTDMLLEDNVFSGAKNNNGAAQNLEYTIYEITKKGQNDQTVINANTDTEKLNRNNDFYLSENEPNSNVILNPIIDFPQIKTSHQLAIKVEKGLGNNFGNNKGALSSRNAIFVDYRLNPINKFKRLKFGIDLGVYHMSMSNLEHEQNYSIHHIEGSVDHSWYKMTYKDLVFVSTNLNAYFDFGKANSFRIGLGVDNLLTSRIGMEYQHSEDLEKTNAGIDWGLNRGINKFDLSLGIGYEVELSPKFSFLIDSKIGFRDKTNNDYLNNNNKNRDVSLLLGLKYNIFTNHK